jgi:hypothetical protein
MPDLPADAGFDGAGDDFPLFERYIFDEFVCPVVGVGILMDEKFDGVHEECCWPMVRVFRTADNRKRSWTDRND